MMPYKVSQFNLNMNVQADENRLDSFDAVTELVEATAVYECADR